MKISRKSNQMEKEIAQVFLTVKKQCVCFFECEWLTILTLP